MQVLRICERFGCLPSALYEEPAGLIGMLELESLAARPGGDLEEL